MADAIVIGGGIAGVSAAAELGAAGAEVTLLEAEAHLAFHTTGRSAALYFESYGHDSVRALSRASRRWFEDPPAAASAPFLSPRGALLVAPEDQIPTLEAQIADAHRHGTTVERLTPADAAGIVPAIRAEKIAAASYEAGAADMDVAAIHQAFVRIIRTGGGTIVTDAPVTGMDRSDGSWTVSTESGASFMAPTVVDAAGAWADVVARMAGVAPIGLVPKRRTVFMVGASAASERWPLTADARHSFYFKPDGPQLLCSPADETPSEPCDARPEEIDIALAIERINEMTTLGIRSIRSSWAGLRSFVPDGGMVIGFDDEVEGFFWLAGQGGTGIQTAPAAGALAADLIGGVPPRSGVDPDLFAADRLDRARDDPRPPTTPPAAGG